MSSDEHAYNSADSAKLWKDWNETTSTMRMSLLEKRKEAYTYPYGFYHIWMKPMAFFEWWYATTNRTSLWTAGSAMHSRWFLEAHSWWIEPYMRIVSCFVNNNRMLQMLQIPTYADLSYVVNLVVSLEERLSVIEDASMNIENASLRMSPDPAGEPMEPLERGEKQDDAAEAGFLLPHQGETIEDLAERLKRLENKLSLLLAAVESIDTKVYAAPGISDDRE